ncbi:MAG: N-6 DNA methylase [Capsulimonadaceae bacterium]|nr:N-6 DNA methylase [Capsulimonadaceae bacterium]
MVTVEDKSIIEDREHIYRSYYTKSESLVAYMVEQLDLSSGQTVFEPAGGDGVFIDAVLNACPTARIDTYDINPVAIAELKRLFGHNSNVNIALEDTLTCTDLDLRANSATGYDRIIANPPYGGWQDMSRRKALSARYPDLSVKETYALFLYRCIRLLNPGGVLVFIIPDTWLNLHRHGRLRKYLLETTLISQIALFPSTYFPGVAFGYANMSIVTIRKPVGNVDIRSNETVILRGFPNVQSVSHGINGASAVSRFKQGKILENDSAAIYLETAQGLEALLSRDTLRICDVADCVTGIYSGNDKQFLRTLSAKLRYSKSYREIASDEICARHEFLDPSEMLSGLLGVKTFVPIVKGGNTPYVKPDNWYIDWSREAIRHYRTDKKARFQNSSYYFRMGLGIPMVTSSAISAALIERTVFDQSLVGVFPKDATMLYYLLAFFNSPTANTLIRALNSSSNNPANYIKKIPFVRPSDELLAEVTARTDAIVKSLKSTGRFDADLERQNNEDIADLYNAALAEGC